MNVIDFWTQEAWDPQNEYETRQRVMYWAENGESDDDTLVNVPPRGQQASRQRAMYSYVAPEPLAGSSGDTH